MNVILIRISPGISIVIFSYPSFPLFHPLCVLALLLELIIQQSSLRFSLSIKPHEKKLPNFPPYYCRSKFIGENLEKGRGRGDGRWGEGRVGEGATVGSETRRPGEKGADRQDGIQSPRRPLAPSLFSLCLCDSMANLLAPAFQIRPFS
jgi:hypothetical protein